VATVTDVVIRPVEPRDAADVRAIRTHAAVARWLGGTPYDGPDPKRDAFEGADPDATHVLGAFVDGRLAGLACLTSPSRPRIRHLGSLWMAVHPDHQGRGVGSKLLGALVEAADRWLGLVRLELHVHADNAPALRLYERHGFIVEARKTADMVRDGRLVEGLTMGRLCRGFTPPAVVPPPPAWPAPGRAAPAPIVVRAATLDDVAALAALHREESVLWGTMQIPTSPDDGWRRRVAPTAGPRHWSLVAEIGGRIAGNLGLAPPTQPRRLHVSGLGMGVHPEFQGMGVGRRLLAEALALADDWLDLRRVELEVYPDNTRARALYERHGFVEEGVRRCAVFRDGVYVDSVMMARVRP
jgi:putative acetyltransferase